MNKDTTMAEAISRFVDATNKIDELNFVINGLRRTSEPESVSFTANDTDGIVVGETYYVKSIGVYVIRGTGTGKVSYVVKDPVSLKTLYSGSVDNTGVSSDLYLTTGDLVQLHSSNASGTSETVTLQQTYSLFDLVDKRLQEIEKEVNSNTARISNLINSVDRVIIVPTDNKLEV